MHIEIASLHALAERLDEHFVAVVQAILALRGRVIVMGMGKSGHAGSKIAATLASTGTPAFFVHPAEASHGDLGMVRGSDLVLALSNSGESHEITDLLPVLKRQGVRVAAMTGNLQSTLAQHADWVLDTSVEREACPLNLAPTASTTVQLALGDALATALLDARGFQAEDFARSHPGGSLGRRLLTHVRDVMRSGTELPEVQAHDDFFTVMREMSAKNLGAAIVVDANHQVLGIFTDGGLAPPPGARGRFAPGHRPGFNAPAPAHHCPACAGHPSCPNDGATRHYQRGRGRWRQHLGRPGAYP